MSSDTENKPLPVTVLSGFLGSGKTTLLRHILHSASHGLRIAIIVNDMASINIDARSVTYDTLNPHPPSSSHPHPHLHQNQNPKPTKEKIVQMQNGCICCTLRTDLLTSIAKLAWSHNFDHILIESSGISEPMQVAETFSTELSEEMVDAEGMDEEEKEVVGKIAKVGGLGSIAYLDTMATVVDASRFLAEFETTDFVRDRHADEDVPEEDQRTIADLFIDQIEFANVVVVNKIDTVDAARLGQVKTMIRGLNREAKILEARYSKVDVKEMLGTKQFDLEKAITSAGWLHSLKEMTVMDVAGKKRVAPKPETLEYGIGSFVYQARRPFDPKKLQNALARKFILLQDEYDDDSENEEEDSDENDEEWEEMEIDQDEDDGKEWNGFSDSDEDSEKPSDSSQEAKSASSSRTSECSSDAGVKPRDDPRVVLENKRNSVFAGVHRSKGLLWFATRPQHAGGWSTAGAMMTINYSMPFWCTMPESEWPEEALNEIKADCKGEWGDRRQELVFLGEKLDEKALTELLDSCLLTSQEMKKWEKVMKNRKWTIERKEEKLQELWNDEFWEEWGVGDEEEMDEDDHEHAHSHAHPHHHHQHRGSNKSIRAK